MPMSRRHSGARASARGFSLVELMVGIAVGMFVVAAAALMTSGQLSDNRRLLLETQLQQDLRSAADIVARELRRSSYWDIARDGVPPPAGGNVVTNPYANLLPDAANDTIRYAYRRGSGAESFGFRRLSSGVLQSCQSDFNPNGCSSGWQDLTDLSAIRVTSFSISSTRAGARAQTANGDAIPIPCTALCADGTANCWPSVRTREFVISISGVSVNDPTVTRSLDLSVRLRNDAVQFSSEAPVGNACPAG